MSLNHTKSSRAQISRAAIQRLYIAMQHLVGRGSYKPLGVSGESMIKALLALKPEIYGSIADPERVELTGLLYVIQRLPIGIEECRYIKLITREGFEQNFTPLIPGKRRRNCYRIDEEQMYIEMTRGRSDIYDVLTHLTFIFIESEKIRKNGLDSKGNQLRDWSMLKQIVVKIKKGEEFDEKVGYSYLSTLLGRTYDETVEASLNFQNTKKKYNLFNIVYWLGKYSIDEYKGKKSREIRFSSLLREMLGHHIHGEQWANNIKSFIYKNDLNKRPIHIISSNLHSVMNSFYAKVALKDKLQIQSLLEVAEELSIGTNEELRNTVMEYALQHGMSSLEDHSGANIGVQIFDCKKMDGSYFPQEINSDPHKGFKQDAVIIVMDYAFGEQAYECMDELLKPFATEDESKKLNIKSINIMGKAGILTGGKGDIMIPNAHVFEGTADNYPFENTMDTSVFEGSKLDVYYGPMITVLGTSLQNKDILEYFHKSSWSSIGLEMEGAHYQKAIQAASKIRKSIDKDVTLRYAYYASDNPIKTGSTLASGALGKAGVQPTYLITIGMLNGIMK